MSDVKFIRKNGRIIPIRDKKKEPVADYKTTAALGATSGASAVAGGFAIGVAKATGSFKAAKFGLAGLGAALIGFNASLIYGGAQASKFEDKGFIKREVEGIKQLGATFGGSIAGSAGAAGFFGITGGLMAAVNRYRRYAASKYPKALKAVPKIVKIIK